MRGGGTPRYSNAMSGGRTRRRAVWGWVMWFGLAAGVAGAAGWLGTLARGPGQVIGGEEYVAVEGGSVLVYSSVWDWPPAGVTSWIWDEYHARAARGWPSVRVVGSRYSMGGVRWGARMWVVEAPLWMFAVAGGVVAAVAWRRRRAWERLEEGRCVGCGYSLAGLRAGAVCPECGRER